MRNRWLKLFSFLLLTVLMVTGCATARARRADASKTAPVDPQVAALQSEIQAKDQQIQELQRSI